MICKLLNVKREAPHIVTLPEPIRMVGVQIRTGQKTIFRDAQQVGKQYQQVKEAGLIQNKREPWAFVAISKNFEQEDRWDYLMGDVVTHWDAVPAGLTCFEIPSKQYARFSLQPRALAFWGIAMGLLKKYIYTEWLPNSKYEADSTILGDFEYHDARSVSKKPEIDLYVSIQEK